MHAHTEIAPRCAEVCHDPVPMVQDMVCKNHIAQQWHWPAPLYMETEKLNTGLRMVVHNRGSMRAQAACAGRSQLQQVETTATRHEPPISGAAGHVGTTRCTNKHIMAV